jgi:hypothetical protein
MQTRKHRLPGNATQPRQTGHGYGTAGRARKLAGLLVVVNDAHYCGHMRLVIGERRDRCDHTVNVRHEFGKELRKVAPLGGNHQDMIANPQQMLGVSHGARVSTALPEGCRSLSFTISQST